MEPPRAIPAERLAWLEAESVRWEAEGLIGADAGERLRHSYTAGQERTRPAVASGSATAVVVGLGGLLVAVGVVLLVAANVDYDRIGPLTRFLAIAAVWLGAVALAELGVSRMGVLALLRGPLRALAVAAFGATIFQAAQSLQVPSYEPGLIAAWAAGSLAYAYAVSSVGALVLAISVGVVWYGFAIEEHADSGTAVVLALGSPVPLLLAVAAAHARTPLAALGGPWRGVGALLGLFGLFLASVPGLAGDGPLPAGAVVALVLGLGGCAALAFLGGSDDRLEAAVAAGVGLGALLLVAVAPSETTDAFSSEGPSGAQVAFTLVAIAVFVLGAVGVAVVGLRRQAPGIADAAGATLFVFVLFQSFGVLAPLASGAALVLLLGVLLVVTGVLIDRGRRRLREAAGS